MRWISRVFAAAFIFSILVAAPTGASAKMPVDHVIVEGPGVSTPIRLDGESKDALVLMETSGYSQLVGDPSPRVVDVAPTADLGPRYRITYVRRAVMLADTRDERVEITQSLYPFAQPDPVAYMPASQHGMTSQGGWFVTDDRLSHELERLGAVAKRPSASSTDRVIDPRPLSPGLPAAALAVVVLWLSVVAVRRRTTR